MPAILANTVALNGAVSHIAKRENWARKEAGVVVVFCIIFVVAVGLLSILISKKMKARKERNAARAAK